MKTCLSSFLLLLAGPAFGQWAVFDVAGLQQSVANYGAMVEQIARQGEQIANQVRQIQQMEDRLKRMGNMADIKNVVGFPNLRLDLGLPTRIRIWAAQAANGRGIFGDTRGGIFVPIEPTFADFDGGMIEREPAPYAAAQQITAKVDEFKEVQADVYARREQLKRAIAQTSEALQAAETEAEEKKLEAVLNAQYSQLAALDSEVASAALSGFARGTQDRSYTPFGSTITGSLSNGAREGVAEVFDLYAHRTLRDIEQNGYFVRVPAGKEFYVYVAESVDPEKARVAGAKPEAEVPAPPTAPPPAPQSPDEKPKG